MNLSRALGTFAAAIVLAWAAALGCTLLLPTIADDGVPDAAASETGGPKIDTCDHAFPPGSPDAGRGTRAFRLAVQTLGLVDGGAADLGYDLDGVCTCHEGTSGSCVPLDRDAGFVCDDPRGRDKSSDQDFAELLAAVFATTDLGDVNKRIANGHLGYLFDIVNTNGAGDAYPITLRFYNLSHLPVLTDAGTIEDRPPAWDGTDLWAVDCALSLAGGCPEPAGGAFLDGASLIPTIFDTEAYVVDRKLIARFDSLVLGLGVAVMRLKHVIVTANVTELDGGDGGAGIRLDGQLVGRFALSDVLNTMSYFESPENDGFLCGENRYFTQVLPKLCASADIAAKKNDDGSNVPCDALSVAIPFVALPADIAYRADKKPRPQGCDGGGDGLTACARR